MFWELSLDAQKAVTSVIAPHLVLWERASPRQPEIIVVPVHAGSNLCGCLLINFEPAVGAKAPASLN